MSLSYKEIQDLLKFINRSNLVKFEMEEGDFKLKIVRQDDSKPVQILQAPYALPEVQQPRAETQPSHPLPKAVERAVKEEMPVGENTSVPPTHIEAGLAANQQYITSPMIGTFYRASSPDKPNYVEVGDTISVGQTLCIIEAMKLFNEIESEVSGKVVKVLVDNAQPVEYDQPLFVVELTS